MVCREANEGEFGLRNIYRK